MHSHRYHNLVEQSQKTEQVYDAWRRLMFLRNTIATVNVSAPVGSFPMASVPELVTRLRDTLDVCTGTCDSGCYMHLVSIGNGDTVWGLKESLVKETIPKLLGQQVLFNLPPSGNSAKLLQALDGCDVLAELRRRAGPSGLFDKGRFIGGW